MNEQTIKHYLRRMQKTRYIYRDEKKGVEIYSPEFTNFNILTVFILNLSLLLLKKIRSRIIFVDSGHEIKDRMNSVIQARMYA